MTLPTLKCPTFQGISAYLESLVAQLTTPHLEQLSITLFNQVAFTLLHLSNFTNTIERLRLPDAKVMFDHNMVSMVKNLLQLQLDSRTPSFSLHVLCKQLNWQIDTIMQICSVLMPTLSIVKRLTLDFNKHRTPTEWQDGAVDSMMWHELLRPFVRAVAVILRAMTKQGKVR